MHSHLLNLAGHLLNHPSGLLPLFCMQCVAGKYRTSNGQCSDCMKNFYCPGNGAGRVTCGNSPVTQKTGAASKNKW
jgi:hypothetical protein